MVCAKTDFAAAWARLLLLPLVLPLCFGGLTSLSESQLRSRFDKTACSDSSYACGIDPQDSTLVCSYTAGAPSYVVSRVNNATLRTMQYSRVLCAEIFFGASSGDRRV
jgi:hypothetical protein